MAQTIDGACVYAALRYGSKRHVERIVWWVELESESPDDLDALDTVPSLTIRRRSALDALGLAMGLNRSLATGHDELDAIAYVEATSSADDEVRRCLASSELKQSIANLVRDGLTVRLRRGRLTVTQSTLLDLLGLEDIQQTAHRVAEAARHLPRFRRIERSEDGGPDRFQWAGLTLTLLAFAGAFATALAPDEGIIEAATSPVVMTWVALGVGVLVVLSWRLTAGTSVGLRRFSLLSIPGALACASWAMAVAAWCGGLGWFG